MLCLAMVNTYNSGNAPVCCIVLFQQKSAVPVLQLSSSTGIADTCERVVNMSHMNDSKASTWMLKLYFFGWVWVWVFLFCALVCFKTIIPGKC